MYGLVLSIFCFYFVEIIELKKKKIFFNFNNIIYLINYHLQFNK